LSFKFLDSKLKHKRFSIEVSQIYTKQNTATLNYLVVAADSTRSRPPNRLSAGTAMWCHLRIFRFYVLF